jgi:hypothetical protein
MKINIAAASLLLFAATVPALNAAGFEIVNSVSGLAAPATTITFSEVPLTFGDSLTNQFASDGVTFENLFFQDVFSFGVPGSSSLVAPSAVNEDFTADTPVALNPYTIDFSTSQTDVAFGLVTNAGDNTTITASECLSLDSNCTVVDTITNAATDNTGNFFGFSNFSPFNQIQFTTTDNGGGGTAFLDTIQFGSATPEPGTWVMLVLGIAGIAGGRRFRRS